MSDDAALIAEIAAAPDDAVPYLVLADALQLRGDPRGDLIAVQHALETAEPALAADLRRREAELLETHAASWLAPVWPHRKALVVRWRRGFVHAARVVGTAVEVLDALLEVPGAGATLAELRLGPPILQTGTWPPLQPLVDALCERWPASLRRLFIGEGDPHGLHDAQHLVLGGVLERAEALEQLVVQGPDVHLGWRAAPPRLRVLDWRVPRNLDAIAELARWPSLEELTVWAERPDPLGWLDTDRFPRLRRLALVGAAGSDAFSRELAALPIVAQLERLEVSGGTLTARGAADLAPLAQRLELDLRRNLIARTARAGLAEAGIRVSSQRRGRRALSVRAELDLLESKVITAVEAVAPGRMPLRRYRAIAELAELADPLWQAARLLALARRLPDAEAHVERAALARAIEAELGVSWLGDGASLCAELGRRHLTNGEVYDAERWLWRALVEARWIDHRSTETDALANLASVRIMRGDPNAAAPLLEVVATRYGAHSSSRAQLAWTRRMQANVELVRCDYPAAEKLYREALALYRGDRESEAIVLGELAGALWMRQDFEGAEELMRDSLAMRDPESLGAASSHYNLGALLNMVGRIDEAIAAGERSLELFRRHRQRAGEGRALSLLGELHQRSGDHDRARTHLEEALVCMREIGALREEGVALGNLSRVALDVGDYAGARAYCEHALECHRTAGNRYNEGMQLLGLADAAIGERRLDDALANATEALVPLEAIDNKPAIAAVRMRFAFVALLRGDFEGAERYHRQSIAEAQHGKYPELVGWNELWLGVVYARRKKPREAYGFLGRARAELGRRAACRDSLEMATAVVARLGGSVVPLPEPRSWDARLLASLV